MVNAGATETGDVFLNSPKAERPEASTVRSISATTRCVEESKGRLAAFADESTLWRSSNDAEILSNRAGLNRGATGSTSE